MDYQEMISALEKCFEGKNLKRGDALRIADAMKTMLAERDAAVEELSKRPHHSTCKYGEHCDYISAITGFPDCYSCDEWEWRGPIPIE